ncbi:MAG: Crp/Fnr family transcriptional regulator [Clostridiales bacterium]|nr:Crp/Fnr family transcriptional regulator [Clostridiales bacterium]
MKNLTIIRNSTLFQGTDATEIDAMLSCLSPQQKIVEKGTYIYRRGETIMSIGLVISGSIHIFREDFWGNRSILSEILPGQTFGETIAASNITTNVNVAAAQRSEVLLFDLRKILKTCPSNCEFHNRLILNLVNVLAEKNLFLTKKIGYLTKRTTREKLLSYLSDECMKAGSAIFQIPFNRQQLADFLSVDRSAMSNELSRLKAEGILNFQKNTFRLKNIEKRPD